MSVVQLWLLVGIPLLLVGLALFIPSSPASKLAGYLVLAAGFVVMAASHTPSGAVFGMILALLYASGQGLPRQSSNAAGNAPSPSAAGTE